MNEIKQLLTEEKPYIEVIGTADREVIPDEIYIKIVIREKHVFRVKVTIESQEEKLMTAIKSLGIDLTNLYLSDANANYVKIRWQNKDVQTEKQYTLKVSNATTVGRVFEELEKLDIKDAYITKVSHSKIDSIRKEVRIIAIKDAKDKADYLLNAIGEQTGKPLIINESPHTKHRTEIQASPTSYFSSISNSGVPNSSSDKENEIQFQKITLTSSIYVKFSIK
jgi:uncharacterized protein YggE